jgi:hypothetical protein
MPTFSIYVSAKNTEVIDKHRPVGETIAQTFARILSEKADSYRETTEADGTPKEPQFIKE